MSANFDAIMSDNTIGEFSATEHTSVFPPVNISADALEYFDMLANGGDMCDDSTSRYLQDVYAKFDPYFPKICLALCIIGIMFNTIHICILTQKSMHSTINTLLTTVAMIDISYMILGILYNIHYRIISFYCSEDRDTWYWSYIEAMYANISIFGHATNLWLIVAIGAVRNQLLQKTGKGNPQNQSLAFKIIVCTMVFTALITLPIFLISVFVESTKELRQIMGIYDPDCNGTAYYFAHTAPEWAFDSAVKPDLILHIGHWVNAIGLKILPCLAIFYYTIRLSQLIRRFNRQHDALLTHGTEAPVNNRNVPRRTQKRPSYWFLVAIFIAVLVLELPQALPAGLILWWPGIGGQYFQECIYSNLADSFDILSLSETLIASTTYCCMSHQYREQLGRLVSAPFNWLRRRSTL